jgi:2-desacetyl-2-hydroxyethyl bacteriochlorophyllide A dehydrogenase
MDQRVAPPQVIGHVMSGTIVELGADVRGYDLGDRVVVRPLDYCGACPACDVGHSHVCHNLNFMGIDSPGAFQSSWTVKARTLHKLPDRVSLKNGALIEPLSVACHDVSRSRLMAGEKAVVIGGGPIGQLIAQVAKAKGAEVMISELNKARLNFAEEQGVKTVNPVESDIKKVVDEWTDGKGADVVFEVSGVQAAVATMTDIAAVRGRLVMVAIHSQNPQVDLFQFFWRELELLGARVYEAEDFENAIDLVASGDIDLDSFISFSTDLPDIGSAFSTMDSNPAGMKAVVACNSES